MGNCTASKLVNFSGDFGDGEDVVSLCKSRKHFLKSAVARRAALAAAHHDYVISLRSLAGALNLFILRHSSPPSPILITNGSTSAASFRVHTPSEPKKMESLPSSAPPAPSFTENKGYLYISEQNSFQDFGGWDFFNPFEGVRVAEEVAMMAGLSRSTDEDLKMVREKEGIPELEEAEEEELIIENRSENIKENVVLEKELALSEAPRKERELLDALRDVEDQFIRAYDSGKELGKLLEISWVDQNFDHDDHVKESSSKLVQAITWNRSPSSQSSSRKSFAALSSKDSSFSESKSDIFEECGGMESGSHSQTLDRLYAWEKKLYEEVKAGDQTRQIYEKKCRELRIKQDTKGVDSRTLDKTKAAVSDSYTRIWVALRSIETISIRIHKARDDELQPQLLELLQGLLKTWKVMLETHETQKQIMEEVNTFACPSYGKFCTDSQRQVTVRLEGELQRWRSCFTSYVKAQRDYAESIDGWLSKFFTTNIEYYSRSRSSSPTYNSLEVPPLVMICHDWSKSLKKLPDKPVSLAMKGFIKATRVLWVKQGDEQQQKRKVDILSKELDRRKIGLKKAENKVLESKLSDDKSEQDAKERVEFIAERKDSIESFSKKVDIEKGKHQECMKETQRVTLDGFRIGLTGIFETTMEFSKDCLKLYGDLLMHNEKAEEGKSSCIEGLS